MEKAAKKLPDRALMEGALLEIRRLRKELEAAAHRRRQPIAIIGLGCRLPAGISDAESYWRALENGVDAVTEFPPDRLDLASLFDPEPGAAGKTYCRHGAFLEGIDLFDPAFFGISPREADGLDPQQRLLLEVAWEALEDAALDPRTLVGSSTGVFAGLFMDDYSRLGFSSGDPARVDAYNCLGSLRSLAAGRLSYTLGLRGPTLQLDTACSSSLVAVHLACLHLQTAQCDLALAGGANLILSPESTLGVSQLRGLSKQGRCRSFDASADGYVRGEGCALVVLKRLDEALAQGDPIHAVIRGSAINHDGHSNGLTAPSGSAQEAVIRAALKEAQIRPQEIPYVETHGTGTGLGDPIEATALGNVLGPGREPDNPLWMGASKTNFGHLEAAAGTASLLKAVLAVTQRKIPPNLHFSTPNPHIPWDSLHLAVPTKLTPWPDRQRRIAGVSSFGMSGTNAHVIVEEAPATEPPGQSTAPQLFCLSARSATELRTLARRHGDFLQRHPHLPLESVCATAAMGRQPFSHRLAIVTSSLSQLTEKLLGEDPVADLADTASDGNGTGTGTGIGPKAAFLFTGQGSRLGDLGRSLYRKGGEFRQAFDRCSELFEPFLGVSLAETLFPARSQASSPEAASVEEELALHPPLAQPALFSLQAALTSQWRAWGVEAAIVLGYSFGEISAAWAAGVLSLEQAVEMVAQRSELVAELGSRGAMAVVELGGQELQEALDNLPGRGTTQAPEVEVAAILGPDRTVVSGPEQSIRRLSEHCRELGVRSRQLSVSHAFHSSHLDPVLEPFGKVLKGLAFSSPKIPLISNLSGQVATSEITTVEYWQRQLRETIQWSRCLDTLGAHFSSQPPSLLVEIGPEPVLLGLAARHPGLTSVERLPSLRHRRDAEAQLLESLGRFWVAGGDVNWTELFGPTPQRLHLPTYPFERQRYWLAERAPTIEGTGSSSRAFQGSEDEPSLLGRRLALPGLRDIVFEASYSLAHQPILSHHRLRGEVVVAAATWVSSLLAAAASFGWESCVLEDLLFAQPLRLSSQEERIVHLVLQPRQEEAQESWKFQILSFPPRDSESAVLHASGHMTPQLEASVVLSEPALSEPAPFKPREVEARCPLHLTGQAHYSLQEAARLSLAPPIRWLAEAWRGTGESLARLERPNEASAQSGEQLRAGWLDGCFQALGTLFATGSENRADNRAENGAENFGAAGKTGVPFRLRKLVMAPLQEAFQPLWCHAFRSRTQPSGEVERDSGTARALENQKPLLGDLRVVDTAGRTPLRLEGLEIRSITSSGSRAAAPGSPVQPVHKITWRLASVAESLRPKSTHRPSASRGLTWIVCPENGDPSPTRLALQKACSKHFVTEVLSLEELSLRLTEEDRNTPSNIFFLSATEAAPSTHRPPPVSALESACELLELVQLLARHRFDPPPHLTVVTHNAQSVGTASAEIDPAQSALWGLAAVIAREHPEWACRCLDLDAAELDSPDQDKPDQDSTQSQRGLEEAIDMAIGWDSEENRLALRQGKVYLARLTPEGASPKTTSPETTSPETTSPETTSLETTRSWHPAQSHQPTGTLLITGGLGGVGLEVARWWVEQGGRNLLLTGRRPKPTSSETAELEVLRQAGAMVLYRSCDVSDRHSVATLWTDLPAEFPPIDGVVHAAGVVDDGLLEGQNPTRFRRVFSAKALGAWHLHQQTLGQPLSLFLCCSSAASLLGTPGQAAYAAANAFLDGLCHLRRHQGLAALSVNWGPWEGRGMAARSGPRARDRWEAAGVSALSPAEALAPLPRLLGHGDAQALVMHIDWETFSHQARAADIARRPSSQRETKVSGEPFLAELARPTSPRREQRPRPSSRVRQQLAKLPPREGRRLLAASLRSSLEEVSGLGSPHPVAGAENLFEIGLDSLMAVDLRSRLEDQLGVILPTTFVFDHPTLIAIERELSRELFPVETPSSVASPLRPDPSPRRPSKQIAAIEHLEEDEAETLLLEQLQRLNS